MDILKAWEEAKAAVLGHAEEIKRKTAAGTVRTMTRTEAERLIMEPTPIPAMDTRATIRKIREAHEALQATKAKLSRGCGQ